MILRAQTLNNEMVYFGVEDAPVCLNNRQSILCNRPNSPIINTRTIARGTEDKLMFEFDFVCRKDNNTLIGYVVYTDGFYIYEHNTGKLIPIRDTSNISFVNNEKLYKFDEISNVRTDIRFSNGNRKFRLNRIMYSDRESLYIELKGYTGPVPIESVHMCTGVGEDRKELFYGQYLRDGVVSLHEYHPMVRLANGEYRELEVSDYA